ncbi:hypothetical protein M0805_005603 [Coniferiporia weirii]|nr:hypothetical protein M0805_005603 [Coniferiporia weirii]
MSFRDVRASRASRQPKSYILPTKNVGTRLPASEAKTGEAIGTATGEEKKDTETTGGVATKANVSADTSRVPEETPSNSTGGQTTLQSLHPPAPDALPTTQPPGLYAGLLPILLIKKSKKRGRGLWSKVGIPAGTVVFSVRPHVHILSRSQLGLHCTSCCVPQSSTGLKKCTKCRTVYYCGTACQNADWPSHKLECDAIQKWAATALGSGEDDKYTVPPEAVRCLARIIWKRKKLGSSSIWWKEICEMQSHQTDLSQSMVDAHVHLAHALVRYMGIEGKQDLEKYEVQSISELVNLISKFTSNSFTLITPSLSPIGVSVSPLAALINHSCDPNVAVVFPRSSSSALQEPALQVVVIQDVPPDTELFTSYIDITLPIAQRQKDLKETYSFVCMCSVCSPVEGTTSEDWRALMWCPKECGGTCPFPTQDDDVVRCSKCRAVVKDTEKTVDIVRIGQEALEKATALQFADPEGALKLTQNIIPLLTGARLVPSAHPLLALQRLHQSLLIATLPASPSQEQLDEVIRVAAASVAGLSYILQPGHPVRAVALAELGKLLAVDEPGAAASSASISDAQSGLGPSGVVPSTTLDPNSRGPPVVGKYPPTGAARLQLAVQTLQQAHAALRVAFGSAGEGGEVGCAVRELLVRLENELGVWRIGIRDALDDALAAQRGVRSGTAATLPSSQT